MMPEQVDQQIQVQFHVLKNGAGVVEIQSKARLELRAHSTYLPFDVLDQIYAGVLQVRIQQRASSVQGASGSVANGEDGSHFSHKGHSA